MKPILAPLYPFSLLLLFVTLLVTGESTTIYSPTDVINLNCGSSGDLVYESQTWSGDINSKLSPIEVGGASQVLEAPRSSSTGSQVPYTTARLSYSEFTYRFPVNPGQKFIRLYFYPESYNADFNRSKSLFSVKAGGYTLLKDFNASVTADAEYIETMLKEFCINIEPEQQRLNITFTPSKDGYAFINGIEIMSMPAYLYYTAEEGDGPSVIGTENRNPVENNTAMEMIYRINVGGIPISPNEDTGMYRTWYSTDEIYLNNQSRTLSMLSQSNKSIIRFAKIPNRFVMVPNYTAPVDVYRSGRSIEANRTISKSYNLTWGFPVDPQFDYLVRLHFCEIIFELPQDRVFQIFIADQPAEQKADIIQWTGGKGIPVYRDYLVFVPSLPNQEKSKVDIIVALRANPDDSKTRYPDAILNGLEIFKLNDTNGNLAGPNPDPPPLVEHHAIYTPSDAITLSCGSLGQEVNAFDNRTWIGDVNSKLAPREVGDAGYTSNATKAPLQSSSPRQVPYTTARISRFEFTYRFPISPGQKFVRLYFYPASYPNFTRSEALFFVTAGRYILLNDFNASLIADTEGVQTIYKEFCVNIDSDPTLDLTFTPSRTSSNSYAFINGIEIVSMPPNLYYNASEGHRLDYVGNKVSYHIENSTALEMVYRINIGGKPLSSMEDTGMYRSWDDNDHMYLDDLSRGFSVIPKNMSIRLKFESIPEYTAPAEVYLTGRSMGMNNLTWEFPVDSQISYMVRLHFCEFEPNNADPGDRMFQLYIANQTAEKEADIVKWGGGNGIPIYRDYYVFMSDPRGQKTVNLSISMGANPQTIYTDAILNGLEIFKLFDSNGNNIDLNRDPPTQAQMHKISNKSTPVIAIVAGVLSSILVFFALGLLVIKRRWKAKDSNTRDREMKSTKIPGSPLPSYLCRYFSLAEIKAATKNFNDTFIIGAGGFGNVYKGCIDGGATPVAIKRLKPESSQGAHEFKTEIEMLSQLRHRHLVSLIGYCADKGEMILVYDYMARGTLRNHLYHTDNQSLLWEQRLHICIGTARGLQYLHSGAKGIIIHRDVKSTNILLDDKWVAKVSDFGLSKGTANMSKTHISTVVKGSFGYLDPEYYRRQRLTEKSDVYSLGVVLFEVLCARPAVIQTEELKQVSLAEWAKSCHQNGELDQIIDPNLRGKIGAECLNKFSEIAISCMHDNGIERPSMTDVVRGLELALQLQQCAEGNINYTERNVETEPSSSEQSCATNNSIKCISATIFSEINNPSGR